MKLLVGRCALHGEVNCPDCDLDSMLERDEPDLADEFSKCAGHLAACHTALTNGAEHSVCKGHAMKSFEQLRKALED